MREQKCPRLMPNGCYDDDNDDSNCLFAPMITLRNEVLA